MKSEKKKDIVIIILIIVIVFGGAFLISELKNNKYENTESYTDSQNVKLKQISVDDYLTLKAQDSANVIYIARPTCSHCQVQTPRMKYIQYKYKVTINYLNTDAFGDGDYDKLTASDDFFKNSFGTPTILITKANKIVDSLAGESEASNVVTLFKNNGLIK